MVHSPGAASSILSSENLLRWFAVNLDLVHDKMEALPIGLENKEYRRLGVPANMARLVRPVVGVYQPGHNSSRPILSYIHFTPRPQTPQRGEAMRVLANISTVVRQGIPKPYTETLPRNKCRQTVI